MSIIDCIRQAVNQKVLGGTFSADDVSKAIQKINGCAYSRQTIQNFLPKHRRDNPGGEREYFERISTSPAKYKLI